MKPIPRRTDSHAGGVMRLKVLLPTEILVDDQVVKVIAQAENGSYCLLPRHVDFVAALGPGILSFSTPEQQESFVAVAEGALVKCGQDVLVSTLSGVRGEDLGALRQLVEERFIELDEHERKARTALARLEAGTLRRFRDLQERFRA